MRGYRIAILAVGAGLTVLRGVLLDNDFLLFPFAVSLSSRDSVGLCLYFLEHSFAGLVWCLIPTFDGRGRLAQTHVN